MKIAVNTRLLLKNKLEGIGWFTYETMKRITQTHPEHQFYFIFDRPYSDEFVFENNITPIVIGPPSRHPVLWYLWFEFSLYQLLKKLKPDIFISPDGYLPLKTKVNTLAVIHDIAYEHYPETVPFLARIYYKYFFPKYARKANRIATVSNFSKEDIVKYYKIPADKIDVVYNGFNEGFHPVNEEEKIQVRAKYSNGKPYFIFLGGLYPRKNISRLISAFETFKRNGNKPMKLLLVGKPVFWTEQLIAQADKSKFREDIIFTGRIDSFEELNKLVSAAEAMVYVSIFEGFGIPCLEAMQCGIPVICSNTSSMPEVCGDAALYVDPLSIEDIANAMEKIIEDKELRNKLLTNAGAQLEKYSWEKTSQLLWQSAIKIINLK